MTHQTAKREKALRELGEASGQVFMIEDNEEEEEEENLRRLALLRGLSHYPLCTFDVITLVRGVQFVRFMLSLSIYFC